MNVNRKEEGAIKNICVIIILTNSKQPKEQITGNLKGHSQLVHMRIAYHSIANLHVTEMR